MIEDQDFIRYNILDEKTPTGCMLSGHWKRWERKFFRIKSWKTIFNFLLWGNRDIKTSCKIWTSWKLDDYPIFLQILCFLHDVTSSSCYRYESDWLTVQTERWYGWKIWWWRQRRFKNLHWRVVEIEVWTANW